MIRRSTLCRLALGLLLTSAAESIALAHVGGGEHPAPAARGPRSWGELWRTWGLEPGILLPLALSAWLYARGVRRLWRDAGPGRGVRTWEVGCFAGGWLA